MNTKVLNCFLKIVLIAALSAIAGQVPAAGVSDQIESLIKQGQLNQALTLTENQLASDSGNVNYLFLKGLILTRQNKLDDAKTIFIKLTKEHPELPEPFNNLAVIYAAQGDFTSAREALQKAIDTHPSYATAQENLGDIYAKMASRAYNQALELDNENSTAREKLLLVNNLFSVQASEKQEEKTRQLAGEAKQKAADLNELEQRLQKTRNQTEQELDKADQARRQTKDLRAEQARALAELEAKRTDAEREAREATTRVQTAQQELTDLKQQSKTETEQLQQQRHKAQQQLNDILAEIDARKKDLDQITRKRDSVIQQAQTEQKQAEEQARRARAEAVQANKELAQLEQKQQQLNDSIKQQTADAQAQIKQARDKLGQLQSDITQREQDRQAFIGRAKQERNQAVAQIDTNRTELEKVSRELERLRGQRESLEKQNQQLLAKLANNAVAKKPAAAGNTTAARQPNADDVIQAVRNWAGKWSAKDVEGYLASYANDFKPPAGMSRSKWNSQRRRRLRKPRFIRVSVDNFQVKFIGDSHARVTFDQGYKSDTYSDRVSKTLLMAYRNGRWLIAEETSD